MVTGRVGQFCAAVGVLAAASAATAAMILMASMVTPVSSGLIDVIESAPDDVRQHGCGRVDWYAGWTRCSRLTIGIHSHFLFSFRALPVLVPAGKIPKTILK